MRKIVQIDEYEYDKLTELAKLNEQQISKRAIELWEKEGVAEIRFTLDTGKDYFDTFTLNCKSSVFYKNGKFVIQEELRNRFRKIIDDKVMYLIEKKFGGLVKVINRYNKKIDSLDHLRLILLGIAASGWAVAAVALLMK